MKIKTKEEILNKYIKGDLKRDYNKQDRNYYSIYIQSALNALSDYEKELKKKLYSRKEVETILDNIFSDILEKKILPEQWQEIDDIQLYEHYLNK